MIEKFYDGLKDIKYGWYDKNNILHTRLEKDEFRKNYKMQSCDSVLKSRYAICWEMCEVQREYFDRIGVNNKTIFVYLNNGRGECHTFSVFNMNNYWYWFEASWERKKGIHKFNSLNEILDFYRDNFEDFAKFGYNKEDIVFYEYDKALAGCSCEDFYKHCLSGKLIK